MSLWDDNPQLFGDAPFRNEAEYNHPTRKLIVEKSRIGKTVLECGCASCVDYDHFKDSGMKYIGIDITLNFIEAAKRLNPEVDVRQGNIIDLKFKDESYDTVYCRNVLEHLNPGEWTEAIKEMWRVARKQILMGFFIIPDTEPIRYSKDEHGFNNNKYNIMDISEFCISLDKFKTLELLSDVGGTSILHESYADCSLIIVVGKDYEP